MTKAEEMLNLITEADPKDIRLILLSLSQVSSKLNKLEPEGPHQEKLLKEVSEHLKQAKVLLSQAMEPISQVA